MNQQQKEIQAYLKRIKPARRAIEIYKERCKTYNLIYDSKGSEYRRLEKDIKAKQKELINDIEKAQEFIDLLPDMTERSVLSLYYIDCLTMPEIAERMMYQENTMWIKHSKALQHLSDIKKMSMEIK